MIASKNNSRLLGYDLDSVKQMIDEVLVDIDSIEDCLDNSGNQFWDYFGDYYYEGNEKLLNLMDYAVNSGVIDYIDNPKELKTFLNEELFLTAEAIELLYQVFAYIHYLYLTIDANNEDLEVADDEDEANDVLMIINYFSKDVHHFEWNGEYMLDDYESGEDDFSEAKCEASFNYIITDPEEFYDALVNNADDFEIYDLDDLENTINDLLEAKLNESYDNFIEGYDDYREIDSNDFFYDLSELLSELTNEFAIEISDLNFDADDDIYSGEDDDYIDYDEYLDDEDDAE